MHQYLLDKSSQCNKDQLPSVLENTAIANAPNTISIGQRLIMKRFVKSVHFLLLLLLLHFNSTVPFILSGDKGENVVTYQIHSQPTRTQYILPSVNQWKSIVRSLYRKDGEHAVGWSIKVIVPLETILWYSWWKFILFRFSSVSGVQGEQNMCTSCWKKNCATFQPCNLLHES